VRGPNLQPNAKRKVDAAPAHKVNMARVSAGGVAMWNAADVGGRIWRCGRRQMWGEGYGDVEGGRCGGKVTIFG
jgi:hypothetical protein